MTDEATPQTTEDDDLAGWAEGDDSQTDNTVLEDEEPETAQAADDEATEETPDEEAADEAADDEGDLWASATESQRKAVESMDKRQRDLEHKVKSFEGRVPGLQRENDDLRRRLQELEAKPTKEEPAAEEPQELDLGDDWDLLQQDYPSVANGLKQALSANQKRIQQLETQLKDAPKQQQGISWRTAMDAARPGWHDKVIEIGKDGTESLKPAFSEWLDKQSDEIKALANQSDPWSVMQVYDLHEAYLDGKQKHAEELRGKRKEQLEKSASEPGRSSRRPPDNDPLAGWAA